MQTKKGSVVEVCCNVGTGFITAFLTWKFIFIPQTVWFGWNVSDLSWWQIFYANAWFTLISVIRGYLWRRYFNKKENIYANVRYNPSCYIEPHENDPYP